MVRQFLDGDKIKQLLIDRAWTQQKLAEIIGLSLRQVERLLAGQSAVSTDTRDNFAEALKIPWEEIILPAGAAVATGTIPLKNSKLFGRDEMLRQLVGRLRSFGKGSGQGGRNVLSLQGTPGVGKTVLAVALAYDERVRAVFPEIFWKTLGKHANPLNILNAWCSNLGVPSLLRQGVSGTGNNDPIALAMEAGRRLRAWLLRNDKHILFVLDDAWSLDHLRSLTIDGGRCATIITTRLRTIIEDFVPAGNRFEPSRLNEEDALKVLKERVGAEVIARHRHACCELIKRLDGLPLAIVVAGGLLGRSVARGRSIDLIHSFFAAAGLSL
ncbi:MAG: helix-turn-helix domain-containing protein [Planctomycetes bacterium]|nr:helix-turn-helix domain-containing protein [Planctomycetota bacterium]